MHYGRKIRSTSLCVCHSPYARIHFARIPEQNTSAFSRLRGDFTDVPIPFIALGHTILRGMVFSAFSEGALSPTVQASSCTLPCGKLLKNRPELGRTSNQRTRRMQGKAGSYSHRAHDEGQGLRAKGAGLLKSWKFPSVP